MILQFPLSCSGRIEERLNASWRDLTVANTALSLFEGGGDQGPEFRVRVRHRLFRGSRLDIKSLLSATPQWNRKCSTFLGVVSTLINISRLVRTKYPRRVSTSRTLDLDLPGQGCDRARERESEVTHTRVVDLVRTVCYTRVSTPYVSYHLLLFQLGPRIRGTLSHRSRLFAAIDESDSFHQHSSIFLRLQSPDRTSL